jgi:predicted NBD/HSP70 family sugar kinase
VLVDNDGNASMLAEARRGAAAGARHAVMISLGTGIGGGAVRGGELLLEPARAVIAAHALPPAREGVRLVPAHYGDEAGMMGAALMALESLG